MGTIADASQPDKGLLSVARQLSSTRLLVLGAVWILQPVHGYLVRRELLSWRVDEWASIHPGSIYNALRALQRDGFLDQIGTEAKGGRPARTTYQLTDDGKIEFRLLLRDHLWTVEPTDPTILRSGLAFMWAMTRDEVIDAMEHRASQLEGRLATQRHRRADMDQSPDKPDHVAEIFLLDEARIEGELRWSSDFIGRLRAGAYGFYGEDNSAGQHRDWLRDRGMI